MKRSLSVLFLLLLVASAFSSVVRSENVAVGGRGRLKIRANRRSNSWSFPNFNGYTVQSFAKTWNIVNDAYGKQNRAIVKDPVPQHSSDQVLRVFYPKGSYNPSGSRIGGTGFYAIPIPIPKGTPTVTFSYEVLFPNGFVWNKGGKLPGLYAGHDHCSGGNNAETCFSTRMMWRQGGIGELYAYLPKKPQVADICTLHQGTGQDVCNNDFGFSLDRGAFSFQPGVWHTIQQTVTPNAKGRAETGQVEVWFDGKLVIHFNNLDFRLNSNVNFLGIDFETFFGGSDSSWATPKNQYTYFTNVNLSYK